MVRSDQGTYWAITTPDALFVYPSPLIDGVIYAKGQQETGDGGYVHWQWFIILAKKQRQTWVTSRFPGHVALTRSSAYEEYVWKEDTRVPGTQFVLGSKPIKRNSKVDWDCTRQLAEQGKFAEIDSHIYIQYYSSLKRIAAECEPVVGYEKVVHVFWGATGTGKSRRAFEEAGLDAYVKDPLSKWWCGYQGQENVVIDEFRGVINISHLLRWFDRYPVRVETKGSSRGLCAKTIWITSNLDPREWYPELDEETKNALLRRLRIVHFVEINNPGI